MNYYDQAIEKLNAEFKAGKYDRYAEIMKTGVRDALLDFCGQDTEFAQAVCQGGSFEECMRSVAKDCGHGISDLEAYRRAARFYFDGAAVRMTMTIQLESAEPEEDRHGIVLDLTSFF